MRADLQLTLNYVLMINAYNFKGDSFTYQSFMHKRKLHVKLVTNQSIILSIPSMNSQQDYYYEQYFTYLLIYIISQNIFAKFDYISFKIYYALLYPKKFTVKVCCNSIGNIQSCCRVTLPVTFHYSRKSHPGSSENRSGSSSESTKEKSQKWSYDRPGEQQISSR